KNRIADLVIFLHATAARGILVVLESKKPPAGAEGFQASKEVLIDQNCEQNAGNQINLHLDADQRFAHLQNSLGLLRSETGKGFAGCICKAPWLALGLSALAAVRPSTGRGSGCQTRRASSPP